MSELLLIELRNKQLKYQMPAPTGACDGESSHQWQLRIFLSQSYISKNNASIRNFLIYVFS